MGVLVLSCAPIASAEQPGVESEEQMSIDDAVDLLGLLDEEQAAAADAQPGADVGREDDGDESETAQASTPASADAAAPSRAFGKALPPEAGSRLQRIAERSGSMLATAHIWAPRLVGDGVEDLMARRLTRAAQVVIALGVAVPIFLWLAVVRLLRGRGDAVVCIDYPAELRGTFAVRLSTRKSASNASGRIKNPEDAERARTRASLSSRTEHHQVARETHFRDVPCDTYYLNVDGFLQTGEGEDVVSTHFAEREVRIQRRGTARVELDFHPRSCPVEVRVMWDKRPVQEAQIARRGIPGAMRFVRGTVHYSLDRGQHTLVVGSADRVAEYGLDVQSFQPIQLVVDLSERESLLFTGCPPAVETYLAGDVPATARALERDGQNEVASVLLARFHEDQGQCEKAADHYEAAGLAHEAASLRESLSQYERAALLYEQSGDDERAAPMSRSAGKLLRAGDAYARADAYDSAVECFAKAGDVARWVEALSKKGEIFEAAKVALDQGDRTRAIQLLTEVGVTHPNYPEAAVRLAEAYQNEGHVDLAIHKLDELIATRSDEDVPLAALDLQARLLEEAGDFERALEMLAQVRERDATWPGLSTRIEALKKRRSQHRGSSDATTSAAARSGFDQEFRYEILDELGRGGMGIVFKARDRRLGRIVALKRLPDNLRDHPKAVELFLREARAAASLNHANVVTLFDAGQEGGTYYITMELLEGMPLQKILKTRGRLSPASVAKIGGQVATGLAYAHEQGVVHRDIKTANLFFTNKKIVKIMDFGLAKMVEEVRRATTVIGGTPYYMAPEQSAGESVDHRADIYALGVTFYELLTGSVPFREGDVAFHHRHTPPPDMHERAEEVPEDLAQLVRHMMAKLPENRCASALEVRERLQEIARGL